MNFPTIQIVSPVCDRRNSEPVIERRHRRLRRGAGKAALARHAPKRPGGRMASARSAVERGTQFRFGQGTGLFAQFGEFGLTPGENISIFIACQSRPKALKANPETENFPFPKHLALSSPARCSVEKFNQLNCRALCCPGRDGGGGAQGIVVAGDWGHKMQQM